MATTAAAATTGRAAAKKAAARMKLSPDASSPSHASKLAQKRLVRQQTRALKLQKKSVVDRLSNHQVGEFREAFKVFDKDGSGSIDEHELGKLMASVGQVPSESEVREMVRIADADGSGEVDFYEFVALMAHKMSDPANEASVAEAFALFDRNGDGQLNKSELAKLMMNVGEPATMDDIDGLLDALDMNGDGSIDVHEFSSMVLATNDDEVLHKHVRPQRQAEASALSVADAPGSADWGRDWVTPGAAAAAAGAAAHEAATKPKRKGLGILNRMSPMGKK